VFPRGFFLTFPDHFFATCVDGELDNSGVEVVTAAVPNTS